MLNKQRRIRPILRKWTEEGRRVVRERFGIDPDTCTGDHSCIRLSGCPSLSVRDNPDPLRRDPIATVQSSCVGCGLCGEVAHAAVLCPSFYRAEIVSNPTNWDLFRARWSGRVIGWLQRRAREPAACLTVRSRDRRRKRRRARSPSRSWRWAARAAACSPTGSSILPSSTAISRRARRCRGWRSAPGPRSTTSKFFPAASPRRRDRSRCSR